MKTIWIVLGGIAIVIVGVITALVGANNAANRYEQDIIAAHDQSRNVLGQYAPKLAEAMGVTKVQAQAVERVFTAANESRYGEQGSQASVQWIREQNPNLDQSNYGKVINLIEAGRKDFENAQKDKIDRVRGYRTALGNVPGGSMMKMLGWPSEDFFKQYGGIVTSGHAKDSFESGIDNGLNTSAM